MTEPGAGVANRLPGGWVTRSLSPGQRRLVVAGLVLLVGLLVVAMTRWLPDGVDWRATYRPAALALIRGRNPFDPSLTPEAPFFAAPWGLLPLVPLALLPVRVGRALLLLVSIAALAFTARRLGASIPSTVAFLLSPPVLHGLLNANVEWLPLLGFVLPPQVGLLLVLVKPQTGFAVGIFWLVEVWRQAGWREVLRVFAPASVVLGLSFVLYGPWLLKAPSVLDIAWFNASLWPATVPVGIALLVASIKHREMRYAMGASPCLSPYVLFHSWSGALAAVLPAQTEMLAAVAGLWVLVAIRALA